ncbi:GAF domain-containing protein [Actinoplanes friuliensis]|uniref:Putative transcriptional regulator n=1 Tax=Actinoplanes friuliensis DSM 7358 TaxID=1246995 RepID=U5VR27_9ACTN|nr:GAF domain-containing protein [Actinoplanes friuliensis]AGZ39428.1 putative transcriptional regulator [Actinoplanes friuliensis DSM 7358]
MSNPWLALTLGADPTERISQVGRAHERFVTGEQAVTQVRSVVADSWRRSAGALVNPDSTAPIELSDGDLEAYRAAHPLARVLPIFRDLLGGLADDGDHMMAVCDAHGRLLWVEGTASVLRGAESMNFVPGARWDEAHAGTNAPGTALAVDHPLQIFATEHFSRGVQRWTCAAAPIHDPATGRLLGAIDVTGGDHLANPHSLALVRATALAAEAYLSAHQPAPEKHAATVSVSGREDAVLSVGGRRLRLGRRHSELLVLLLVHPEGRTGDQLAFDLYADDLNPVTVRAELSRLRRILGPELLDSRPYRLRAELGADFLTVTRLLECGLVAEALAAYDGPLLPSSDAPGIVRLRRLIDSRLRAAVLTGGDPRLIQTWVGAPWGADDLEMWEAYATALPPGSPARPHALNRVVELAGEYGLRPSVSGTPKMTRRLLP